MTSAVMLVGGKGTRSANPGVAKVTQTIAGRPLLSFHRDLLHASMVRELIIVTGHLHDQVQKLVDSMDWRGIHVQILRESEPSGTVAALNWAASISDSPDFVVMLGDILMSFPIDHFVDSWHDSGSNVAVAVHPSTHMGDSDAVVLQPDGSVQVVPKGSRTVGVINSYSAGLFGVTREGLRLYGDCTDIGSDLLPLAAAQHDLFAYISSHYFKDTGTADRLARAVAEVEAGVFERRGLTAPRAALFLDRDGVINAVQPEVYRPEDYFVLPGVAEAISHANTLGIPVFVVTNQPGIAKGLMTEQTHQEIRARLDSLLAEYGAFVDDYFHCPHHPDSGFAGEVLALKVTCKCRKPEIELVTRAQIRHGINLAASVMVGDTWRDQQLAANTGMRFIHVAPAKSLAGDHEWYSSSGQAISKGVELLQC